ncbi:MAG: AAA family ATPase [Planctomycetota bacterium]
MKLHRLTVKNYRALKALTLDFENALLKVRPLTVVAGPNGSGKTSILFAIAQALRGPMGYRTDDVPDPTEFDIRAGDEDHELRAEPAAAEVVLEIEFDADEQEAIREVFAFTRELKAPDPKTLPQLLDGRVRAVWGYPPERRPDGTFKPTWQFRSTDPPLAWRWFMGRQLAVRGWRQRKLPDRSLLDRIGGLHLFPQDRHLRSRVTGEGRRRDRTETDTDDVFETTAFETAARSTERCVADILAYVATYSRTTPGLSEREDWDKRIRDAFAKICGPKEYLGYLYERNDPIGAPYLKDGSSRYPLAVASSGEQVILEYLTRLTYPSPLNRSLILIDEPEIHLHPRWVRQLYRALPQMGENNQFVLTTHSRELRELAAEDGVLVDLGDLEG